MTEWLSISTLSHGQSHRSIHDVTDELPSLGEIIEIITLQGGHNTTMVILGTTLLGLAAGVIGVFALLRKRSLMADALSHATLPGIALAFIAAGAFGYESKSLPVLLMGATITGVIGVVSIQLILKHTRLHEDAAIGIVLSVFFGAGVVGLRYIQSYAPSGSGGLNHFIYGQAATMQPGDVLLMGAIALAAIVAMVLFLKEFAIVCFNDSFARVDGWPIGLIDLIMMALVVLVTVAGLQAVGLILVVSMLIIPAVTARFWAERLLTLVILAAVIGGLCGYAGSVVSAIFPRKPAGAVIVLTSGTIFVLSMLLAPARGAIAIAARRLQFRLRVAGDHILEHAYELGLSTIGPAELGNLSSTRHWSRVFRVVMLWRLKREGMVLVVDRMGVELSAKGIHRGGCVNRNHILWEQYLISYADVAPNHVDWSVDVVEHVLSDDLITELELALNERGVHLPQLERGGVHGV